MKPTVDLFIGSSLSGEEARFLVRLISDLSAHKALIFANFEVGSAGKSRQIDFLIVTEKHTELLEHKSLRGPVFGTENGRWRLKDNAGKIVAYPGENPWSQASQAKIVLSDAMLDFAKNAAGIPLPINHAFFREFDASVCIYPQIHPESRVTKGNFKAHVRSYSDCLASLLSRQIRSNWGIVEWRRFAIEALGLRSATLQQALDTKAVFASDEINGYFGRLLSSLQSIPPLGTSSNPNYGPGLIEQLLQPENLLLVGPSGSGKSFHLKHTAVEAIGRDHIAIVIQPKSYRVQGFLNLVQQAIVPYYSGPPTSFISACRLTGLPILLIVDGINECPPDCLDDLSLEIRGFLTQHDARVIVAGHSTQSFPDLIQTTIKMAPLSLDQKRAIYAHYAGTSEHIDHLCAPFTNAFDLTLAGKSHSINTGHVSRVELYDRYCRASLPAHLQAVSLGLLRLFAAELQNALSFSLPRGKFDQLAEDFLKTEYLPLRVLDELRTVRLLDVTEESVSFDHELLLVYFRAEDLRRLCKDANQLEEWLRRPMYQDLLEFILPRISAEDDAVHLISTCATSDLIQKALAGECGDLAQKAIRTQCNVVLDRAEQDLDNIGIRVHSIERENGKVSVTWAEVEGNHDWTSYELSLFAALINSLDDDAWRHRLFTLFSMTEAALHVAAENTAQREGFKFKGVWRETVRCVGYLSSPKTQLPALQILEASRMHQLWSAHRELAGPMLEEVLDRVRRDPTREFSLLLVIHGMTELSRTQSETIVDRCIELLRMSSSHGSYLTRIDALELFRRLAVHASPQYPDRRADITAELERFDKSDPVVNTTLLEILGCYGAIDPLVPHEIALHELRRLVAPDAEFEAEITKRLGQQGNSDRDAIIAEFAYSSIARIFEGVFQGVYSDAYESLTYDEKVQVLCAAGMRREGFGFATDWILAELARLRDPRSLPVFLKFGATFNLKNPFVHESVSSYIISMIACANFLKEPPEHYGADTAIERAWYLVGCICFWNARLEIDSGAAVQKIRELWTEARGSLAPAMPDVLYHVTGTLMTEMLSRSVNLVSIYPNEVRGVLEEALNRRDEISTLIGRAESFKNERIKSTIELLGKIGSDSTVLLLQKLVDHRKFGYSAVDSIREIRRRLQQSMAT